MASHKITDKNYYKEVMYPKFIIKDNCILFATHYHDKNFKKWIKIESNKAKLEKTINHVHLSDLADNHKEQLELGKKIKKIWQNKLNRIFPEIEFDLRLNTFQIEGEKEWILDLNIKRGFRKILNRKKLTN